VLIIKNSYSYNKFYYWIFQSNFPIAETKQFILSWKEAQKKY
jgi:hypothetical protein